MDFHCDGKVNYSEFLAATISSINFNKEEKLWSAFNYFDTTDSGYITLDSIINALKESGVVVDEEGLNKTFVELKKQGKKINFDEFRNIAFKSFEDDLKERTESKKSIEFEVIKENNDELKDEDDDDYKDENNNDNLKDVNNNDNLKDVNNNDDLKDENNNNDLKDEKNNDDSKDEKNNVGYKKVNTVSNTYIEKNNYNNNYIKNSKTEENDE